MRKKSSNERATTDSIGSQSRRSERGAALATSLVILALLGIVSMTVLAVVTNEARIAGSDLQRTQTFYAAATGVEKMTNDFSALFNRTSRPTNAQLDTIAATYPTELTSEGFTFGQSLALDSLTLGQMGTNPTVTIPSGPFSGLIASVTPYLLTSTATMASTGTQVSLQRRMNNYLVPIFQFGMFSNEDLEIHPGPPFAFNGRVHANGNLYLSGSVTFLSKVTTANEIVTDVLRNGSTHAQAMSVQVGAINVLLTQGSMNSGPNISGATVGQRGYFPGSPSGTVNATWDSTSVAAAVATVANKFGGQLLTRTTGGSQLRLPLELDGFPARELVKRKMPNDTQTLSDSRYHTKASIRILLDDETPSTTDVAGIPSGQGVKLSVTSTSDPYYFKPQLLASGKALYRINNDGTYADTSSTAVLQGTSGQIADTVRNVRNPATPDTSSNSRKIPGGAAVSGRILIQVVDANGATYDVTRTILSMGTTEGEPNAIVTLQRPLWMSFTQGSRDSTSSTSTSYLTTIANNLSTSQYGGVTGEIATPTVDTTYGFLTGLADDSTAQQRADAPPSNSLSTLLSDWGTGSTPGSTWNTNKDWNAIVPINVYNVREGYINSASTSNAVYDRGITSVVEINMRNLARWMDGVYDTNLLSGTTAVSTNIAKPDGYTVYVSDRRGDRVKAMTDLSGASVNSSNGMVDNEDIYGPNGTLDAGEDVQATGSLIKDTLELPDPAVLSGTSGSDFTARMKRAIAVATWANSSNYFRRAIRVFNGENLQTTGAANKLSPTLGITISSENMTYIGGNYNTTGINAAPPDGTSALNDSTKPYYYLGNQVPASIVCDAFFPLSKTFFDSSTAIYPDDLGKRDADASLPNVGAETSMRAGIIAGNNLSALTGNPDAGNSASGESRLSGGMHNFPRFLESWGGQRCNFVGSFIPLFHSTQALGQYNADSTIYSPPIRDWAFDDTFRDPTKLPPGTPLFQYIEPTGFKQVL